MSFFLDHLKTLTMLAALGAGVNCGIFFTFSNFIMQALRALPPDQGLAAMQQINITVINPLFIAIFFGTTIVSALLVVIGVLHLNQISASTPLICGASLFVIGTFLVTGTRNVPLNESLANLLPHLQSSQNSWLHYIKEWQFWNTVRSLASGISSLLLIYTTSRLD